MKYGFDVPGYGPLATPDNLITLARRGEEMGFDIIGFSDHIVIPRSIEPVYPYGESGEYYGGPSRDYLEQLATLSFIAGQTSTSRLLTSAIVLPHRSPVLTAKMLASIDVLSKGRLIVGCGIGWMREEFGATGAPPFDERGAVSDEYIHAFKELWTSDNPEFDGKYCRFSNIDFLPKPVQKPHPPMWIGGESPPALRRAARSGDAWFPTGNNPRFPLGTPEQLSKRIGRLQRYAEHAGRDPSKIDVAYNVGWYSEPDAQTLSNGERLMFTGAPEQIAEDIESFRRVGVRHLMLGIEGDTVDETLERLERFITVVKPLAES